MIREALDKSNFACGIFIDLQKAFDTVDHIILLTLRRYRGGDFILGGMYLFLDSEKMNLGTNPLGSVINI